jgi:hypothetical protein
VIQMRRAQLSFGDSLIAEEASDLREEALGRETLMAEFAIGPGRDSVLHALPKPSLAGAVRPRADRGKTKVA